MSKRYPNNRIAQAIANYSKVVNEMTNPFPKGCVECNDAPYGCDRCDDYFECSHGHSLCRRH